MRYRSAQVSRPSRSRALSVRDETGNDTQVTGEGIASVPVVASLAIVTKLAKAILIAPPSIKEGKKKGKKTSLPSSNARQFFDSSFESRAISMFLRLVSVS
jgi:hypothetical protein